jgi:hypothetical protein
MHRVFSGHRVFTACCWALLFSQSPSLGQPLPVEPPASESGPVNLPAPATFDKTPGDAPHGKFLGGLSCASASCHGSPRRESVLGSAAHFFMDRDRHQFGGTVLREERSRKIANRLNLPLPAWESRECLACHAPAAAHATDHQDAAMKLAEGVGCESCHGPARQWLVPHHTREWQQSGIWSAERKTSSGFRETKDLSTRVGVCADCHVGNAVQFVSHDFIAAGHPRLAFEYSAYQALMPVHWRRADDRRRSPAANSTASPDRSTYEARNWLIGQFVSADHELDILSAAAGKSGRAWPELAQYDCFACHHQLSSPSWRQARSAWKLRPGELPWGTWSLGLMLEPQRVPPRFAPGQVLPGQIASDQFLSDPDDLRAAMRSPHADKEQVLELIARLRPTLANATRQIAQSPLAADDLAAIKDALLAGHRDLAFQGWDRAAQLYLAAVALDKGISDARGNGNRVAPADLEEFVRLRKLLAFRETTGHAAHSSEHHDSPESYETNLPEILRQFQRLMRSDDRSNNDPVRVDDAPGQRDSSKRPRALEME